MQAKDLNIVLESAREFGAPLPSLALDSQLFNAMVAQGLGELDNSAVIALLEQMAGIKLVE